MENRESATKFHMRDEDSLSKFTYRGDEEEREGKLEKYF